MISPRLKWETLRTLDASLLNGSPLEIGTPLEQPSVILKMVNTSDALVTISTDGVTDVDVCPAGSFWLYDTRKSQYNEMIPSNTQFYVSGSAGTGTIYLVSLYLENLG